jgi:hypothetical protein
MQFISLNKSLDEWASNRENSSMIKPYFLAFIFLISSSDLVFAQNVPLSDSNSQSVSPKTQRPTKPGAAKPAVTDPNNPQQPAVRRVRSEARFRFGAGIGYSLINSYSFNGSISFNAGTRTGQSAIVSVGSVPTLEIDGRFLPRSRIGFIGGISYDISSRAFSSTKVGDAGSSTTYTSDLLSASIATTTLNLNGAWRNATAFYVFGGINYALMVKASMSAYPNGTPSGISPSGGLGYAGGLGYYFTNNLTVEGIFKITTTSFKVTFGSANSEDTWSKGSLQTGLLSLKYVF